MTQLRKIMGLGTHFIVICLVLSLVSCAQFDAPKRLSIKGQPGDYFVKQIKEQHLSSQQEIVAMLQHPHYQSKKTKSYLVKEVQDTAMLLNTISQSQDVSQAVTRLSATQPNKTEKWVSLALQLYPIDAYQVVDQLYASATIQESTLESAALSAGLEPSRIFPPTASSDLEYRIVPLIHSASLTVYNQYEESTTRLWFKPSDSDRWLPALSLQWEPIMGALSGSIVRLQADTAYDIKLEYLDNAEITEEHLYSFKTRPNSPPIDPEKTYYLSDIYTGGQLNLTTLGIEGSEDGWALIIGDGTEVIAGEDDSSAINIGSQSYIMFENITVKGGRRFAISANEAHHIWIRGCDISGYGRTGEDMRNGVAYENSESTSPINYDSGIYLAKTGVVTVEDCAIHSPNGKANNWASGHPNGPNAMLVWAYHPTEQYRGQYIIRNNRFYGNPDHRFNDVIEGLRNFRRDGSFGRDSAIYNNYLAYANDDLIELDGGQSNVLFYDNELTQGYVGVSTAPNMLGPSYIFNNYIHDLGDDRGKDWTAIKMGGLFARPAGITNLFENFIVVNNNGVARSGVEGDSTFWLNAQNNIIISKIRGGRGIYDKEFYEGSVFKNNLIFNTTYGASYVDATIDDDFYHPWSEQSDKIDEIIDAGSSFKLDIEDRFIIPNFSKVLPSESSPELSSSFAKTEIKGLINFNEIEISAFDNQDRNGQYRIEDSGDTLVLAGNAWKSIDFPYTINMNTVIQLDVNTNGVGEIIGLGIENDNKLTSSRLFKFAGTQAWSQDTFKYNQANTFKTITLPIGQYMAGEINRLVFVLDEDKTGSKPAEVQFKNVSVYDTINEYNRGLLQASTSILDFSEGVITSFSNQDVDNNYEITDAGTSLSLFGNTWKSVAINKTISPRTILEFEIKTNGAGEIAGIAFENDNTLTNSRLYKLSGSQQWSNDLFQYSNIGEFETVRLPIGMLSLGEINRLVFIMDDDKPSEIQAQATFSNVRFYELDSSPAPQDASASSINIGILNNH
ncbi:hypothetical protein [Flavobacterium sp. W21_SRS_FM6]|uniref:hypothetical protein n=1 Tax=Flavobacterium sp. W21_SRS_FM6 TaxID=3240268 RepID=UPI003F9118A3